MGDGRGVGSAGGCRQCFAISPSLGTWTDAVNPAGAELPWGLCEHVLGWELLLTMDIKVYIQV